MSATKTPRLEQTKSTSTSILKETRAIEIATSIGAKEDEITIIAHAMLRKDDISKQSALWELRKIDSMGRN